MQNLFELLVQSQNLYNQKVFLQMRAGAGEKWQRISFRQLRDSSEALARAFKAQGLNQGDHVVLLSENLPEWGIAFFSVLRVRGVVVLLDKLLKREEIQAIVEIVKPKLAIASKQFLNVFVEMNLRIPILLLDGEDKRVTPLARGIEQGLRAPALGTLSATPDSTAVMIFTSGTTGKPKGVMLSHQNFISNLLSFTKMFPAAFFHSNFLSILPLNHAFELTAGFLTPLYGGGTVTYADSLKPSHLLKTMQEASSQIVLAVPAFLEMLHRNILLQVHHSRALERKFNLALKLASLFPSQTFRRWLFRDIHALFGGKLDYFVSGGAPLSGELQAAFEKLGFTVIQGYGLTETAPVLTVNPFHRTKRNSVGKAIPGVDIKIEGEREGEILAKGSNVMKGYYEDQEGTALVMQDGYFRTGDVGYLDKDGYLYISGRLKNLIVTSTGKKVFPEELEEKLKMVPYIKEVCVLGRRSGVEEDVVAVVVPDALRLEAEGVPQAEVRGKIWEGIKKVNATLADYKRVKNLILFEGEFPKTPTLKIKRRELEQQI